MNSVMNICFGGYKEASESVRKLLEDMIKARLNKQGLARGFPGSDKEYTILTGQLRRRFSRVVMEANVSLLLEQMCQIGDGAENAGQRREWVAAEERRAVCDLDGTHLNIFGMRC